MKRDSLMFPETAVVLAAGLGTRFLPVTKSIPKELIPVVDTPGIDWVAREVASAGSSRLLLVTSPDKSAVEGYFNRDIELEKTLTDRGKQDLAKIVSDVSNIIKVESVMQSEAKGTALAVKQIESHLTNKDEAIVVVLPDDLVIAEKNKKSVLENMQAVRNKFGGSVLCAFEVNEESISSYGVFDIEKIIDLDGIDIAKIKGVVEKPSPEQAPSNLAAAGRYILDREIFTAIDQILDLPPGANGEYQLTDAIELLVQKGHPVHVVIHKGLRHDIGNPLGSIKASVDMALSRPDMSDQLKEWLLWRLSCQET